MWSLYYLNMVRSPKLSCGAEVNKIDNKMCSLASPTWYTHTDALGIPTIMLILLAFLPMWLCLLHRQVPSTSGARRNTESIDWSWCNKTLLYDIPKILVLCFLFCIHIVFLSKCDYDTFCHNLSFLFIQNCVSYSLKTTPRKIQTGLQCLFFNIMLIMQRIFNLSVQLSQI